MELRPPSAVLARLGETQSGLNSDQHSDASARTGDLTPREVRSEGNFSNLVEYQRNHAPRRYCQPELILVRLDVSPRQQTPEYRGDAVLRITGFAVVFA